MQKSSCDFFKTKVLVIQSVSLLNCLSSKASLPPRPPGVFGRKKACGAGSQALGPPRQEHWFSVSLTSFFSCLGPSFHTHEMGGETLGDHGCRDSFPRAGTTMIPVGNDFRSYRPGRKQLNKKGNGFSILLFALRLHIKEKASCWCLYDKSLCTCSFTPQLSAYLRTRLRQAGIAII